MTEALIDEVKEQNALFDRGEKDKAFWIGQQNRLKEIRDLNPSFSDAKIGMLVGKDRKWVKTVMEFDQRAGSLPNWKRGSHATTAEVEAGVEKVMRDPHKRKKIISKLSSDTRAEVIAEASRDPEAVKQATSQPKVKKAFEDEEERAAKQRLKENKEKAIQRKKPTPLSQFFWRLVGSLHQTARDLRTIMEELGTLDPTQVPEVMDRLVELRDAAQANIDILQSTDENDDAIEVEGKVIDIKKLSA